MFLNGCASCRVLRKKWEASKKTVLSYWIKQQEEVADPTFVLSRAQNRKFKLNRNQQLKGSGETSLIGSVSSLLLLLLLSSSDFYSVQMSHRNRVIWNFICLFWLKLSSESSSWTPLKCHIVRQSVYIQELWILGGRMYLLQEVEICRWLTWISCFLIIWGKKDDAMDPLSCRSWFFSPVNPPQVSLGS